MSERIINYGGYTVKSVKMQLGTMKDENDTKNYMAEIIEKLNEKFFSLPERSRQDDFESRYEMFLTDIVSKMGGKVDYDKDGDPVANFSRIATTNTFNKAIG